ncbi:hypothetical protein BDF14DRAFT_1111094 [Spinellus fusiger]|nr:hypothetical protein BDF14DRAFT_1111094 [Spinellus fusiger]
MKSRMPHRNYQDKDNPNFNARLQSVLHLVSRLPLADPSESDNEVYFTIMYIHRLSQVTNAFQCWSLHCILSKRKQGNLIRMLRHLVSRLPLADPSESGNEVYFTIMYIHRLSQVAVMLGTKDMFGDTWSQNGWLLTLCYERKEKDLGMSLTVRVCRRVGNCGMLCLFINDPTNRKEIQRKQVENKNQLPI